MTTGQMPPDIATIVKSLGKYYDTYLNKFIGTMLNREENENVGA